MLKKYLPHFLKFFSLIFPRLSAKIAIKLFATPIRIPRPLSEKNYFESSKKSFLKNGIATFGVGKIFVKFNHIIAAKQARYKLSGRKYNGRTVVVSFYPEHYFDINEFSII
jgi:hypothetical protein